MSLPKVNSKNKQKKTHPREYFYHYLGLIFLILNDLKHKRAGYSRPRPISSKKIIENQSYDFQVISTLENNLKNYTNNFSLKSKNILEVGPGPDLGTGILFLLKGANSYTAIDKSNLLTAPKEFYNQLISNFEINSNNNRGLLEIIEKLKTSSQKIDYPNFKYLNISICNASAGLENKFDLIFSQAVLEHINDIKKAFQEMHKLLQDGGVIYHEIDFQTHTRFLREKDPLNILRYKETQYQKYKFDGSPNRLRLSDYIKILKEQGFKDIRVLIKNQLKPEEAEAVKAYLTPHFRDYETSDLQTLTAVIIANKQSNENYPNKQIQSS